MWMIDVDVICRLCLAAVAMVLLSVQIGLNYGAIEVNELKKQAVTSGVAEWKSNEKGEAVFTWKVHDAN